MEQPCSKGADVAAEPHDIEGVGRFGWATDAEVNRVEPWQPEFDATPLGSLLASLGEEGDGDLDIARDQTDRGPMDLA